MSLAAGHNQGLQLQIPPLQWLPGRIVQTGKFCANRVQRRWFQIWFWGHPGVSSVILIDSSTESPVHDLMLSIQTVNKISHVIFLYLRRSSIQFLCICILIIIFYIWRCRNGAGNTIENSSVFFSLIRSVSCRQQGHAGSKTLLQQNPPVLHWGCRLVQVVLYNGRNGSSNGSSSSSSSSSSSNSSSSSSSFN